jgi:hypothetical protein
MVPSCVITVVVDGERLTCSGFSLGKTIRLGRFEFIADLSLSPRRGDSGAAFMGSTHKGTPSSWRAMIEDSAEEFLKVSSREEGFGLPSPRRHGTGLCPLPSQPHHGQKTLHPLKP